MPKEIMLDLRGIPPRERHPLIFDSWENLPVGGAITLVNDHDPKPLYYEFRAERNGEFAWRQEQSGPDKWVVLISRVAAAKKAAPICAERTVKEVSELYPATREVFARHGLDLCCGGEHPIGLAAHARGADEAALLAELNAAVAAEKAPPSNSPVWAHEKPEHELDVREDIRRGAEPFAKIMAAAQRVKPGEKLLLRVPFEPVPLYKVLGSRGFSHWAQTQGAEGWLVYFRRNPEAA